MADELILADGIIDSYDFEKNKRNGNVLVIGSTGSGKTVSISLAQIMHTHNDSLIVSVSKKSIIDKCESVLKRRGYNVAILDIAHPAQGNVGFDPMSYVHSYSDVSFLSQAIIGISSHSEEARDPYWNNAASSLIAAEMCALLEMWDYNMRNGEPQNPPTMLDVLNFHDSLEFYEQDRSGFTKSSVDTTFEKLLKINPNSHAYRYWKTVKGLAAKTVSCVASTVNTAYAQMFTPAVREIMDPKCCISFEKMGVNKTVLFIVTSPVNKSSQLFANVVYGTALKALFEEAEKQPDFCLQIPVHIICDDFACGAKIPHFAEYISIMRACGVSATVLVQSLTQLNTLYGENEASTIIDNCDSVVFLGGNDVGTCSTIARRIDEPLQKVVDLPLGMAIVIRRGVPAKFAKRFQTYKDAEYIFLSTER